MTVCICVSHVNRDLPDRLDWIGLTMNKLKMAKLQLG